MTKTFETFEICSICNFGTFCDSALVGVGAQRVAPLALGDEQKGQDRAFRIVFSRLLSSFGYGYYLPCSAKMVQGENI